MTFSKRLAGVALTSVVALGGVGCSSGEHDQTLTFLVKPYSTSGAFGGYTDITFGTDLSSIGTTNLWGATLSVQDPTVAPDLSFLTSLVGKVGTTQMVHEDSFPVGEPSVDLNIDYTGDLRTLVPSGNMIRIDWSGTLNPDYKNFPAAGIWMSGNIVFNVQ